MSDIEPQTTNPDTCRHDVVGPHVTPEEHMLVICISCSSTVDMAFVNEHAFDYDIDHNCWVRNYKTERLARAKKES